MEGRTLVQRRWLVPLALGLGVVVLAAQGQERGQAQAAGGPLSCKIEVQKSAGGVELQGVVTASRAGSGTYELEVLKSGSAGSSNISQDGEFDADAGVPARLGVVSLSGDGGSYHAKLKVMSNGEEASCEKTVSARL